MPPNRTNWSPVRNRSYESPYLNVNNCPNTMINPHTGAPDPSSVAQSVFTWSESGSGNTHSICSTSCQTDSDCPRSSNSFSEQIPGRCTWGINSSSSSEGVCMPNIIAFGNILSNDLPMGANMDYAEMIQLPIIAYILGLVRNYHVINFVGSGDRVDNIVSQERVQSQVREIIFSGVYDQEIEKLNNFAKLWGSTLYPSYKYTGVNLTVDILGFLREFGLNWSLTKNTPDKHNNLNVCPFGSVMTLRTEFPNTCFSTTSPGTEVPPECRRNTQAECEAQQGCTWGINPSMPGMCVHQPQRCVNKQSNSPILDPLCAYLPSGSCKGSNPGCDTVDCSSLAVDQCYPSLEQSSSFGCCYLEPIL